MGERLPQRDHHGHPRDLTYRTLDPTARTSTVRALGRQDQALIIRVTIAVPDPGAWSENGTSGRRPSREARTPMNYIAVSALSHAAAIPERGRRARWWGRTLQTCPSFRWRRVPFWGRSGEHGTFGVPCFVVTHRQREQLVKGPTTFTFVTDGVESRSDPSSLPATRMSS